MRTEDIGMLITKNTIAKVSKNIENFIEKNTNHIKEDTKKHEGKIWFLTNERKSDNI
jgi:hypothetical protein